MCVPFIIFFFLFSIFLFHFFPSSRQPQTFAFFPGPRNTLLLAPSNPARSIYFFALTVIYIFLWFVTHIDKEPSISYRLMITHNGHSRTISFRSSCDYLNKFYSSTITAPSRLCHLQFYRPNNKHGQDSGDFTTSYQSDLHPNLGPHIAMHTLTRYQCMLNKRTPI